MLLRKAFNSTGTTFIGAGEKVCARILRRQKPGKMTATLLKQGRLAFSSRWLRQGTKLIATPRRSFYLYSPEPFHPIPDKDPEWKTAEEAVKVITSGEQLTLTLT